MGSLGMPEILVILVVALIIFGPRKLPELGKTLGESLAQFRKASDEFKKTWETEVEIEKRKIDPPRYSAPPEPIEPEKAVASTEIPPESTTVPAVAAETASAEVVAAHSAFDTAPIPAKETKRDWM